MQGKNVAFFVREGIEPPPALVDHDGNLAGAPIFNGSARAFLQVDLEASLFQHDGAGYAVSYLFDVKPFHSQFLSAPGISHVRIPVAAKADGGKGAEVVEEKGEMVRGEASLAAGKPQAARSVRQASGMAARKGEDRPRASALPLARPEGRRPNLLRGCGSAPKAAPAMRKKPQIDHRAKLPRPGLFFCAARRATIIA